MEAGYLGIGLVLVIGIAAVAYGWLSDRTDTRRRQAALTQPPERPIPGLHPDAEPPHYVSQDEALNPAEGHPSSELSTGQRAELQQRLKGAPSLPHGHAATEFATDPVSGLSVLTSPQILVTQEEVSTVRELLQFMEKARAGDFPIVVVAPGFGDQVMSTLRVNTVRHTLTCCAVILPDAEQRRALCSLVDALPVSRQDLRSGYLPDSTIGTCGTWVSSPDRLWILPD